MRGTCHYRRSHHPPSCLNKGMVNGALDRLSYAAPPAVHDLLGRSRHRPRCESPPPFAESSMGIRNGSSGDLFMNLNQKKR